MSCVKSPEAEGKVAELVRLVREAEQAFGGTGKSRVPSPYERQLDFIVPLLCVRENGRLLEFESTFLLEHRWKLSAKDASLSDGYNPRFRPAGKAGLLDVGARGEMQTTFLQDAPDAEEKRAVAAVWESRSGGKCLFVMPTDGDFSVIGKAIKLG